jgi:hypothetical protein
LFHSTAVELLEHRLKLFNRQTDLPDYRPERPLGDFNMIRHNYTTMWFNGLSKNHVTALLPVQLIPNLSQSFGNFAPGNARQDAHT